MKRRDIHLLIGLMSVALLGIVGLQVHQISQALAINRRNFDSRANEALNQVVDRLHSAEIKTNFVRISRELNVNLDSTASPGDSLAPEVDAGYGIGQPEKPIGRLGQRVLIRDSVAIVTEQETYLNLDSSFFGGGELSYVFVSASDADTNDLAMELRGHPRVLELMGRTLEGLSGLQNEVIDRIDSAQLDALLRESLADRGIDLAPRFLLRNRSGQRMAFRDPSLPLDPYLRSPHQVQLFPYLSGTDQTYLHVFFPDQQLHVLRSVWLQALLSLLLSGVVVMGFWLSIYTIFRQKRLSEMKNDFINNMTHELKTPIATISLATDAMGNARIRHNEEAMARYTGIIRDENLRMHRQVERVLQAARFDRGEIDLKKETVDAHAVITQAVETIRLQVRERQGKLTMQLNAPHHHLLADQVHLSNMVYNLLDNANKYSPEVPNIALSTAEREGSLVISVRDHGLGISSADQKQIFSRFYRVSTGNRHDVKGFGLGLSYVKEMSEAHGGRVEVESEVGQGSVFHVWLPLWHEGEGPQAGHR
jgi:two-component system phosphate regulon sensor histidine kinase PhoR